MLIDLLYLFKNKDLLYNYIGEYNEENE